jgi:REP element-mobilizing transposase RayT
MPYARPTVPGVVHFLSRRTTRRHFLLRPDANRVSQRIFLYVLGHYAARHGVRVHALNVMSDHIHLVLSDPRGAFPRFARDVHREVARALKVHRRWDEEVWNKSQTSRVELCTPETVLDKLAYTLCNPVEAGAVERYDQWPGVTLRVDELGRKTITIGKPEIAYFQGPSWPPAVTIAFTLPAMLSDVMSDGAVREAVQALVEEKTRAAHRRMRDEGKRFFGVQKVLSAPITTRGTAPEKNVDRNPTFATGRDRALFFQKVAELRAWRAAYQDALDAWRKGDRDVEFPPHTWLMRELHGARVAEPVPLAA